MPYEATTLRAHASAADEAGFVLVGADFCSRCADEIDRLNRVLAEIGGMSLPEQPASAAGDALTWAQRHIAKIRIVALVSLNGGSR